MCRFGSTEEVGLFEMTRRGLAPVSDPAALLNRQACSASAAAGIIVEANRPMLVEIQVRCVPSTGLLCRQR